jgi:hypothetical protein
MSVFVNSAQYSLTARELQWLSDGQFLQIRFAMISVIDNRYAKASSPSLTIVLFVTNCCNWIA